MLQHWFDPLDSKLFELVTADADQQFIGNVQVFVDSFPNLKDTELVILGIGNDGLSKIREQLYKMPFTFSKVKIADLGNVKSQNPDFIFPILNELYIAGITPIILSEHPNWDLFIAAYKKSVERASFCIVDEKIDGNFLSLPLKDAFTADLSYLAIQSQFISTKQRELFNDSNFKYVRLNSLKTTIQEAEPEIRNADILIFNSNAIKKAEVIANQSPNPNGLSSEESCQIVRYAGFSASISSLCLSGYDYVLDTTEQGASLYAQLIWFFLDGWDNRTEDYPAAHIPIKEFVVPIEKQGLTLQFVNSKVSKRWWVSLDCENFFPCSEKDYIESTKGETTARVWRIIEKF